MSYDCEEIVEGRLLKVRAVFENYTLVFIFVYVSTAMVERILFLYTLCCMLQNVSSEEYLFLTGDFNCMESVLDRNHIEPHMPSWKCLVHLPKKHDLCDIWRQLNGTERQYPSVHTRDNVISLARLVRLYAFRHHLNIFNSCSIVPMSFTDHAVVKCNFILNCIKPKSAYWHFYISLLNDKLFKESLGFSWITIEKQNPLSSRYNRGGILEKF